MLLLFLCCSCSNNNTNDNDIVRIDKHEPCSDVRSSGQIVYNKLIQYKAPVFFNNYLDSIVNEESSCMCYEKSITGFYFYVYPNNNGEEIRVTAIDNIFINDYNGLKGFFVHRNHFFVLLGNIEPLNLIKISVFSFYTALPIQTPPEIDDSKSLWIFQYKAEEISLVSHVKCEEKQ